MISCCDEKDCTMQDHLAKKMPVPLASSFVSSYLSQEIEIRIIVSHTERVYLPKCSLFSVRLLWFLWQASWMGCKGRWSRKGQAREAKRTTGESAGTKEIQRGRQRLWADATENSRRPWRCLWTRWVSSSTADIYIHMYIYVSEYLVWHLSQHASKGTQNLAVKQK